MRQRLETEVHNCNIYFNQYVPEREKVSHLHTLAKMNPLENIFLQIHHYLEYRMSNFRSTQLYICVRLSSSVREEQHPFPPNVIKVKIITASNMPNMRIETGDYLPIISFTKLTQNPSWSLPDPKISLKLSFNRLLPLAVSAILYHSRGQKSCEISQSETPQRGCVRGIKFFHHCTCAVE